MLRFRVQDLFASVPGMGCSGFGIGKGSGLRLQGSVVPSELWRYRVSGVGYAYKFWERVLGALDNAQPVESRPRETSAKALGS